MTAPKRLVGFHTKRIGWFLRVELLLEPRDMWIGLYWKRYPKAIDLYVCVLPVLPINIYFQWDM